MDGSLLPGSGRSSRHNSRVTSELNWMRTGGLLNAMKQGMRSFTNYPSIHPPPALKSETISLFSALHLVLLLLLLPPADLSLHWIYFDETTDDDPPLFHLLSFVRNLFGQVSCSTPYHLQSIFSTAELTRSNHWSASIDLGLGHYTVRVSLVRSYLKAAILICSPLHSTTTFAASAVMKKPAR